MTPVDIYPKYFLIGLDFTGSRRLQILAKLKRERVKADIDEYQLTKEPEQRWVNVEPYIICHQHWGI